MSDMLSRTPYWTSSVDGIYLWICFLNPTSESPGLLHLGTSDMTNTSDLFSSISSLLPYFQPMDFSLQLVHQFSFSLLLV